MKIFEFLKSKQKSRLEYFSEIGELSYSDELDFPSYSGKVNLKNLNYPIEVVFPVVDNKVTEHQKATFFKLDKNITQILDQVAKFPDSKIILSNIKIESILIPDKDDSSFDLDAEIVTSQKEKFNLHGKRLYSLIIKNLNIEEIITI